MKSFFLTLFTLSVISIHSQIININPNKSQEPWLVGGLRLPSQAELNRVPLLNIPITYNKNAASLPSYLDNSNNIHFRPIFNQTHGSCSQASGVGYTFTYEINRLRGTAANSTSTQFPSHYTYNFLNGGSGNNGSWYMDGWDIIKENGCPTVASYGGMAATETHWMSGYSKYETGMNNRIKDYFVIHVGTPEGLNNLKYWLLDHLDGSANGGIVNFAAGVTGEFHMTYDGIIEEWGHNVNHAMTIVGWDDTIEYDYNNDGTITNHIDINNDGIVDMKDWEKGALIMVNSWGTYWGNSGKAYIMYKTLAENHGNGGIYMSSVWGMNVKESQTPQLLLKVNMTHSSRKMIRLIPGVSTDLTSNLPENTSYLHVFAAQGGDYHMRGYGNSQPIEITLDISELLNYITPNSPAKFFLVVHESDVSNSATGEIIDFSIVDSNGNEYMCNSHNVPIENATFTFLSINATPDFEFPEIQTNSLPTASVGTAYSHQLIASGGTTPYSWRISQEYSEDIITDSYPNITSNKLTPNDNDDGFALQTIDFKFPFYGNTYQDITVSTDGSLLFEPAFSLIRNVESLINNKAVSVFAHDLLIENTNQGIYYEGDSNYATFRWKNTLFEDNNAVVDVAVTLFSNGNIKYFYGNSSTNINDWASGISNGKGDYTISSVSGTSNPVDLQLEFVTEPFPIGITMNENGVLEGLLSENGSWDLNFVVTDNNLVSDSKILTLSTESASLPELSTNIFSIYPNPSDELINIEFSTEEKSNVTISLFNMSGKLVDTIFDDTKPVGVHKITYSPNICKGVYIVKITSNDFVTSKKFIFL